MIKGSKKRVKRITRAFRVRKRLRGTASKPRLSVHKTNQHIYLQLIDDESGVTLGSCSTMTKANREGSFGRRGKESAKALGDQIAKIAQDKQIKEIVFDRGSHKYHGVLVELATQARSKGLKF